MTVSQYYIYILTEPNTSLVRYVGVSKNPKRRYKEHIKSKVKSHKTNWINKLLNNGLCPDLQIIKIVNDKYEALELEKYYIAEYKSKGANLTNATIGGESPMAEKKHKAETIIKMSEGRRKEKNSFYGKRHSDETKLKISAALKGKLGWNKGKKLSDEHRLSLCKPKSTPAYNKGITRFDLRLMEQMLRDGYNQHEVAKYFKTDQGTISKYKRKHKFNLYANA